VLRIIRHYEARKLQWSQNRSQINGDNKDMKLEELQQQEE